MFPFPAAAAALAALALATAASAQEMPRFDPLEAFDLHAFLGAGLMVAQGGENFFCVVHEEPEAVAMSKCRPVMPVERLETVRAAEAQALAHAGEDLGDGLSETLRAISGEAGAGIVDEAFRAAMLANGCRLDPSSEQSFAKSFAGDVVSLAGMTGRIEPEHVMILSMGPGEYGTGEMQERVHALDGFLQLREDFTDVLQNGFLRAIESGDVLDEGGSLVARYPDCP